MRNARTDQGDLATRLSPSRTERHPMPDRSDYQPLPQAAEDEPDLDSDVFLTPTSSTQPQPRLRGIRRVNAPGAIDLRKLDAAFKR
jgi:hypothetical protein